MRYILKLFLLLLFAGNLNAQFLFEGLAPEAYRGKTVHLDVIDGWDDFRLIAEDQLLAETRVDSTGHYRFTGSGLPAGCGFYRLRFRDPDASPPVSMWVRNRHFIHFFARPTDTLKFAGLALNEPNVTNALIDRAARQFDRLDEELLSAESDRLAELIEEKRERFIEDNLTGTNAAADVFLLGHWPGYDDAPLPLLEEAEALLVADESMRPEYLTTLRERIGAKSLASHRRQIFLLRLLLGAALIGLAAVTVLFWRGPRVPFIVRAHGRRSKVRVGEQGEATSLAAELSPKEEEVLAGIVAGESNKAIAARLFVSEATVKSHINSIYKKAGIGKRKEAIAFGQSRAL